jgi:hypothetical protein
MPLCARCSKPFVCTCANEPPREIGATFEDCPVDKPGAVWVHVMDDRGIDVEGVGSTNDSDGKPTDGSGTAVFDKVEAGPHTVTLDAMSVDLERFEKPTGSLTRSVTVTTGQIAYVPFQLSRKPSLSVRVGTTDKPKKWLSGASVSATGPESREGDTAAGLAELGRLPAGNYEVKVKLSAKDAEKFATTLDFETTAVRPKLVAGEERVVIVDVEPINVVTPHLTIDPKLVYIDHGPESYESLPSCVTLGLAQTNMNHRYAQRIALKCATETDVEAFWDKECSEGKRIDGSLSAGVALPSAKASALCDGKKLEVYFRGKSTIGKFAVSLVLDPPGDRFVKLGKQPAPVEGEIQELARPHVKIEWLDGGEVDGVNVQLGELAMPAPIAGLAKWATRGIAPGLYDCVMTFPGNVKYLLHDAGGNVLDKASFQVKAGKDASVTYKISKVKVDLAFTCDTGGVAEDVKLKVKIKSIDEVTVEKDKTLPVNIPVIQRDQTYAIETLTLEGDDVYEMVEVTTT